MVASRYEKRHRRDCAIKMLKTRFYSHVVDRIYASDPVPRLHSLGQVAETNCLLLVVTFRGPWEKIIIKIPRILSSPSICKGVHTLLATCGVERSQRVFILEFPVKKKKENIGTFAEAHLHIHDRQWLACWVCLPTFRVLAASLSLSHTPGDAEELGGSFNSHSTILARETSPRLTQLISQRLPLRSLINAPIHISGCTVTSLVPDWTWRWQLGIKRWGGE